MERIQLTVQPVIHRLPVHVPHTHRGWALRFSDGTYDISYEDLSDVHHPRGRFPKPVQVGIFFYGYGDPEEDDIEAPASMGDAEPAPPDQRPHEVQPQPYEVQPLTEDDPRRQIQLSPPHGIHFKPGTKISQEMKHMLSRVHRNMGHPSAGELKNMLSMSGARDPALFAAIDGVTCDTCERTRMPPRPPLAHPPRDGFQQFGDSLQIDIVYCRDTGGANYPILGVICETTHLHTATVLESRAPEETFRKFMLCWGRPYGLPLTIRTDPDGAFRGRDTGQFEAELSALGVYIDYCPPEAHHRLGLIERHNSTMRYIMEKLVNQNGVTGPDGMERTCGAATYAKNSCTWSSGRPPFVAALGRMPRVGLDLLSNPRGLIMGSTQSEVQRHSDYLRIEAQQHLAAMTVDASLRRALLRRTPPQAELEAPVGSIVAYWRWIARSGRKRGGYRLARLLGRDPDQKSFWIQSGTNTIKVAQHQIRAAHGYEQWIPDAADIQALRQASANLQQGILQDEEIAQAPPDTEQQITEDPYMNIEAEPDTPMLLPTLTQQHPAAADTEARRHEQVQTEPQALHIPVQEPAVEQHLHMNISSPSYKQTNIYQQQTFGFGPEEASRAPVRTPVRQPYRARSKTPVRRLGGTTSPQQQLEAPAEAQAPAAAAGHGTSPTGDTSQVIDLTPDDETAEAKALARMIPRTPEELSGQTTPTLAELEHRHTPAKRSIAETSPEALLESSSKGQATGSAPHTVALTHNHLIYNTADGIHTQEDGFDGTETIKMPHNAHTCLNAYRRSPDYAGNGDSEESEDGGPDLRGLKPSGSPPLSRIEQKALDKELPWQFIMQQSEEYIQAFVKSAQDEEASWNQWESVRPLSEKEAEHVYSTPHLRKRILKSRSAFRDKNKHIPPLKAKTRVVAIGCLDPDIFSLNRECATPTRQAEFVLLAFFICGKNKMLLTQESTWTLWSGDVKTAFLQGQQEGRAAPLYLAPPRDPITVRARTFAAPLYEVRGNIYGLANAPRVWSLEVTKRLLKAGYVRHTLDHQLFYYFQKPPGGSEEVLMSVLMVYVDDFLLAHDDRYDREHVLSLFTWGSKTELTTEESICFKGKQIHLKFDRQKNVYFLSLVQTAFIESMRGPQTKIPKSKFDQELATEDLSEMRSVAGSLQWVSGQTRPDVAATVSLSSRGQKTKYSDLAAMFEAVAHLQSTKHLGLNLFPVVLNETTHLLTLSDSSWANAESFASQHGCLTLLAEPSIVERTGTALLLDFKSSRSPRICRSTLAAEASAADMSVDRTSFLNHMICEMFQRTPSYRLSHLLRSLHITDCRSLYDCICSENPNTEEKRTIISIRSTQQEVTREGCHWVPTQLMFADGLTKISKQLMESLINWLQMPWIQLRESKTSQPIEKHECEISSFA